MGPQGNVWLLNLHLFWETEKRRSKAHKYKYAWLTADRAQLPFCHQQSWLNKCTRYTPNLFFYGGSYLFLPVHSCYTQSFSLVTWVVFWSCFTFCISLLGLPQSTTNWWRRQQIYCLLVLETRSPRSGCQQGCVFWGLWGRVCSLPHSTSWNLAGSFCHASSHGLAM